MSRRRFYFVEPSKVGSQHITLIEGYLRALISSTALKQSFDLLFCASRSTAAALSTATREEIKHVPIRVMNPEKRRLILKTLLECYVVTRFLFTKRREDILFVSCVLPTTLLFLEACNRLLRRRGFFVVLHGEVEGLFDKSFQHPRSFGFWVLQWMRLRRRGSTLSLVVIDDFIKRRLLREYPGKLSDIDIFVVCHPISPLARPQSPTSGVPSICFIGYRTAFKGFDQFMHLSGLVPGAAFVAIGGGKVENVQSAQSTPISGSERYLGEISKCNVALFPYVAGYTCSLSAAAVDALSAGAYIVATDRPCFTGLQEYFGPEVITIYSSAAEAVAMLSQPRWLEERRSDNARRLEQLLESKYGLNAVRASFEKLSQAVAT
jgi:hypothetical protein